MEKLEDIAVRPATVDDLTICLEFERKDQFGRHTAFDEQILKASISCGSVFLAERGKSVIGYASLNFLYPSRLPLLSWWYVEPTFQGRGVGSLLLRAVDNHLAAWGFDRMLISACRPLEIDRHRAAQLEEIGALRLGPNELEHFFMKPIFAGRSN